MNKYNAALFNEWFWFCNIMQNLNDGIALNIPFIKRVLNGK